jgi:endonuclease/exonuclease/phosphatase family metal-dependent hydrolase
MTWVIQRAFKRKIKMKGTLYTKIFKISVSVFCFVISVFLLFLLIIVLTDYRPAKETVLTDTPEAAALESDTIEILTWNIGYAGLDSDMDFFYDGGGKTKTGREKTVENLDSIKTFLRNSSADFIFLQEVDKNSDRSYRIDITSAIAEAMPRHTAVYATNYRALFVPLPVTSPMGKVESGIMILSRNAPLQSVRYAYPVAQPFPKRLFLLDRCFVVCRYPLRNGKQLVLVNTHNSAFDRQGQQRREEMLVLKDFITAEYDRGNYVIVGGDWNQIPPLESATPYLNVATEHFAPLRIPDDFMPASWKWVSDGNPTNRFLDVPYRKGKTKETLLDFFLVSPNVNPISTERIDKNYANSDHNPVVAKFAAISFVKAAL